MCAQGGRTAGRLRGVPQYRLRIACAFGMVGKQHRVGAGRFQLGQQVCVQFGLPVRRDTCLDGHPAQLVPEPQPRPVRDQNAGGQAFVGRAL